MRLHGAMLYVKDLALLAAFYEQVLEVEPAVASRTETWLEFDLGGAIFALHAIPAHISRDIVIVSPPEVREETPIKLRFAVSDVAAHCRRLQAAGVQGELRPRGVVDCVDPEGNVFQLCPEGQ